MKNAFLFHQKSSFRSRDIQFFVFFPSFPHFQDSKGQIKVEILQLRAKFQTANPPNLLGLMA